MMEDDNEMWNRDASHYEGHKSEFAHWDM